MKKLLLLLLLASPLIGLSQAKVGTKKYLDEKRGFKSIILGSDIATIKDDVVLSSDTSLGAMPGVTFYEVENESWKKIGDNIVIKKISVGVFESKIVLISMALDDPYGSLIKESFKEAYGFPYKSNPYIESYIWNTRNVMLAVQYDRVGDDSVLMVDNILYNKVQEYGTKKSKDSVKDL